MPNRFSIHNRPDILQKLRSESYDLLIIGGGITGAGIALDAASRGLKTALIEKKDFAFGTSSRSTKLIHGGLRYLKQLEFGLVKEVGSERAVVHNLAPHLVVPEKMLLPLYEKKGLGYWLTSIGLKIYDFLAGVKPKDQRRMLTRKQTLAREPLLKTDDIKGGAIYAEYRTDDARLTLEILKTATRHGADVINYLQAVDFRYQEGLINGIEAEDKLSKDKFFITAKVVVSAAGPWVDELREINRSKSGKRLHLTKGVHVVVPHEKFPVRQAIYFDVEDGRMIFAIPRSRTTYIGTTDTNYSGDKEHVYTDRDDAAYLVRGINATFAGVKLTLNDIESSWAGLRPLIHEEGKSASELSRKDEIFESPTGLISIAGGKLTGYRKMAERVVNLVIKKHFQQQRLKPCYTRKLALAESPFTSTKQVGKYLKTVVESFPTSLPEHLPRYLVETYGRQADLILKRFHEGTDADVMFNLLKAMAWFGMEYEMVTTLEDFFVRRTGLLYFDIGTVRRYQEPLSQYLGQQLRWDDKRLQQERQVLATLIADVTRFSLT
jgi:glycerol-3-phosphate dehydrogenase